MTQTIRERKALTVYLHPAMSHAQAHQLVREMGAKVVQDGRGNISVSKFTSCAHCRHALCSEMQFCARPSGPDAA